MHHIASEDLTRFVPVGPQRGSSRTGVIELNVDNVVAAIETLQGEVGNLQAKVGYLQRMLNLATGRPELEGLA